MPQNSYTDADLIRFARKPLGITIERPQVELDPEDDPSQGRARADRLLAEAKGTLVGANTFAGHHAAEMADIDSDMAAREAMQGQDSPSIFDPATTRLSRLAHRVIDPIPAAAEKAAMVGSFLAPEVAIPSQAVLSLMAGKRLATADEESPLSTAFDVAQVAAPAFALGRTIRGAAATTTPTRVQSGLQKANEFFTGHPNAVSPRVGQHMVQEAEGLAADAAKRAGEAASTRMQARQMEGAGFEPNAIQRVLGLHPKAPRSISTAQSISHNLTPQAAFDDALQVDPNLFGGVGNAELAGSGVGAEIAQRGQTARATVTSRGASRAAEAVDVDKAVRIAQEVAAETGTPVEQVIKQYLQSVPAAQRGRITERLQSAMADATPAAFEASVGPRPDRFQSITVPPRPSPQSALSTLLEGVTPLSSRQEAAMAMDVDAHPSLRALRDRILNPQAPVDPFMETGLTLTPDQTKRILRFGRGE